MIVPAQQQFDPANYKAFYAGVRARLTGAKPKTKPPVVMTAYIDHLVEAAHLNREEMYLWSIVNALAEREREEAAFMRAKPKLFDIFREVCMKHGVTRAEIAGDCRNHKLTKARREYCWRAVKENGSSLGQIGRLIGNRDHTTVLWAFRQYEAGLSGNKIVRRTVNGKYERHIIPQEPTP